MIDLTKFNDQYLHNALFRLEAKQNDPRDCKDLDSGYVLIYNTFEVSVTDINVAANTNAHILQIAETVEAATGTPERYVIAKYLLKEAIADYLTSKKEREAKYRKDMYEAIEQITELEEARNIFCCDAHGEKYTQGVTRLFLHSQPPEFFKDIYSAACRLKKSSTTQGKVWVEYTKAAEIINTVGTRYRIFISAHTPTKKE